MQLSVIKKYNNYYERTKYLLVIIAEKKILQIQDNEFLGVSVNNLLIAQNGPCMTYTFM